MIPRECKRLAEVDFPIAIVSKHAAREKSIRHGHPSTLHLWWARRPLAACRSMLLALLLPDPCDENCPPGFIDKARTLLARIPGKTKQLAGRAGSDANGKKELREALLQFIGDFANWDLSSDRDYLEVSRGLVKAAHGDEPPLVVDPFAGGGSIPLEALRLGCDAFASDLNPVACLILKTILENIPRHGPGLVEELRRVGAEIQIAAEKQLADFYPQDPDGAKPMVYLWARTVRCEAPNCGAEIPLMTSFWLSTRDGRRRALRFSVLRTPGSLPQLEFEVFKPKSDREIPNGTVVRAKATCPCCGMTLTPERVRAQLKEQRGGGEVIFQESGRRVGGARLMCVVTRKRGEGREYRLPTKEDYLAVHAAVKSVQNMPEGHLPNEPLPPIGTLGFRIQRYGMDNWGDLFTSRQKLSLERIASEISTLGGDFREILSSAMSRSADYLSSGVVWAKEGEFVAHTFGRQALPLVWDFAEINPWADTSGSFAGAVDWIARVVEANEGLVKPAQVQQRDACDSTLPDAVGDIWFTDPPYYDSVPYSDLSDFFFVWLKRTLPNHPLLRDAFDPSNRLTPKTREAIQDATKFVDGRPKDRGFFEDTMARAFVEGRRVTNDNGVACVVFAHKSTEGWEALLSGMIRGGWVITGSWPVATERPGRLRSQESAALATSVHLVCRPRGQDYVGDWADVLNELPRRVAHWMRRLESEGVLGADLVFACIGPALEIFSRYSHVETADGRGVGLPEYLEKVWEIVGRMALREVLGSDRAAEFGEDARLTALFLWTARGSNTSDDFASEVENGVEATRGSNQNAEKGGSQGRSRAKGAYALPYDLVRRFCQPLGIHLERWEGELVEIDKGVVRLLSVTERTSHLLGDNLSRDLSWLSDTYAKDLRAQMQLFDDQSVDAIGKTGKNRVKEARKSIEAETWKHLHKNTITLLDHVHKGMLFQKQGMTTALRELLFYETSHRPDFLRVANALSALYPRGSEEKRLLDAMLLAVPR